MKEKCNQKTEIHILSALLSLTTTIFSKATDITSWISDGVSPVSCVVNLFISEGVSPLNYIVNVFSMSLEPLIKEHTLQNLCHLNRNIF